jgi:parvulin-like peptidyl-prolyl isomerase
VSAASVAALLCHAPPEYVPELMSRLLSSMQADHVVVQMQTYVRNAGNSSAEQQHAFLALTRCDTVIKANSVALSGHSPLMFGVDLVVQRLPSIDAEPATIYSWEVRPDFDSKLPTDLGDEALATHAWRILHDARALDVDRTTRVVDPSRIQVEYGKYVRDWTARASTKYHLRAIQLGSELRAEATIARLRKSDADFAAIAAEVSDDRATATAGGDLGWRFPGQLAPEIRTAVREKSDKGLLDHPVQVGSAWLVLEKLDERQVPVPTLAEVHDFLEAKLLWQDVTGLL